MRASKTIISILHRGFDKIKQDGRVMVPDGKSAEKLYDRLYLVKSEGTYKVAFENESKTLKDILSPTNRWLVLFIIYLAKSIAKQVDIDRENRKIGGNGK